MFFFQRNSHEICNTMFQVKINGTLKDVDTKSGIITGYFAAFDNIDSDGDVFVKGAFKKTIKERGPSGANRIMHLLQHDTWRPLGRPKVLREDSKGLYFETEISKTSYGEDAVKLYADGVFNEHSVGFNTINSEYLDEKGYNEIREVKLWEGSTVTWGANSQTPFTGFKQEDLVKRIGMLQKALRNGTYTDNTFELLEIELEQIKSHLEPGNHSEPSAVEVFRRELHFLT